MCIHVIRNHKNSNLHKVYNSCTWIYTSKYTVTTSKWFPLTGWDDGLRTRCSRQTALSLRCPAKRGRDSLQVSGGYLEREGGDRRLLLVVRSLADQLSGVLDGWSELDGEARCRGCSLHIRIQCTCMGTMSCICSYTQWIHCPQPRHTCSIIIMEKGLLEVVWETQSLAHHLKTWQTVWYNVLKEV